MDQHELPCPVCIESTMNIITNNIIIIIIGIIIIVIIITIVIIIIIMVDFIQYYGNMDGAYSNECKIVYEELRNDIIETVYNEWKESGYVWEQYGGDDGHGKRSHPFTGWTSLVLLIMAEQYE